MSFGNLHLDWRQEPARGVPEGWRGGINPEIVGEVVKTDCFKVAGLALKPPPSGMVFGRASLGSFTWLWLKSPQWFGAEKGNGFAQFLSQLLQVVSDFHSFRAMNVDAAPTWLIQWENTPAHAWGWSPNQQIRAGSGWSSCPAHVMASSPSATAKQTLCVQGTAQPAVPRIGSWQQGVRLRSSFINRPALKNKTQNLTAFTLAYLLVVNKHYLIHKSVSRSLWVLWMLQIMKSLFLVE